MRPKADSLGKSWQLLRECALLAALDLTFSMSDGLHSGHLSGESDLSESVSERSTFSFSPPSVPGSLIADRYQVEGLIGQGGFGKVYRAFDRKLERVVALKLLSLPQDHYALGDKILRFQEEVRTVARLDHPSIVPVYDTGLEDGVPWMTMRLVLGRSLDSILRDEGLLPPSQAIPLLISIARALSHAHRHGIVHRDVKPANILLEERDGGTHAWLTDFGIAKILSGLNLTREGIALGTPKYMSPEQAVGGAVDARTDIFPFGCVATELLTGHPAFSGSSAVEVLHAIIHNSPDLSGLRERVGPDFEAAISRCLAQSPENRWQTFDEFAHALDSLAFPSSLGTLATSTPQSRTSRFITAFRLTQHQRWWLATGILAAALIIILWLEAPTRTRESEGLASKGPVRQFLHGEILDAETRLPLSHVIVSLPELDVQRTTDEQGQYRFEVNVPAGTQVKLRATHAGYQPINVDPPAGSNHLETYRMWRNR